MKILITGAKGQLGKAFIRYFDREKIPYIPTDVSSLDITALIKVRECVTKQRLTHIINCAAYNDVDQAEKDWQKAFAINGLGVRNLSICANEADCELIHFSTNYVFSGKKEHYTIADTTDPINKYGESKRLGEQLFQMAKKSYLIRTSWLFGEGKQNFISKLINWSQKDKNLSIADDEIASPTYTHDLVQATMELLQIRAYGLYHITNTPTTRYEWAERILKEIGWKGRLLKAKRADFNLPATRPGVSILDNFGLKETTGMVMRDWGEATRDFLSNYKQIKSHWLNEKEDH